MARRKIEPKPVPENIIKIGLGMDHRVWTEVYISQINKGGSPGDAAAIADLANAEYLRRFPQGPSTT